MKYDYFRTIFDNYFNIGFGSPATDVCSTCLSLREQIKTCRDLNKKDGLKTELTIHKKRADAFFDILRKENKGEITLSFDCQKNQIIPKIPDQASYYLRQLYIYNFTVCVGSSHASQNKGNTFSYVWLENEYKKGSNQIASSLYHRLCNTDLSSVHTMNVAADGCGGQNKNKIVIGMLLKFLSQDAPRNVKRIVLVFPIVGHSYIPPDRVFGRIETDVKKHTTLLTDQSYIDIFNKYTTVIRLGEASDCPILDWKEATTKFIKERPTKRIFVVRTKGGKVAVRGESNYNINAGAAKSIIKVGQNLNSINPAVVKEGIAVKKLKMRDLETLSLNTILKTGGTMKRLVSL